jgi:hypothetical protein
MPGSRGLGLKSPAATVRISKAATAIAGARQHARQVVREYAGPYSGRGVSAGSGAGSGSFCSSGLLSSSMVYLLCRRIPMPHPDHTLCRLLFTAGEI